MLDILQSVPILGFLTFTVVFFLGLFPGQVLGAELAVIFAIFTSQAWNMAFSMYQSLKTVPADLDEASRGFGLSAWQRFWRLEVPFAMPGLVWNTMMSMSGGWFCVVAREAVTVGDTTFNLPGIGCYIAARARARDMLAVFYAILAMLVVILLYDQLLFRPLVAWSAKFRFETTAVEPGRDPWMLALLRRTRLLSRASRARRLLTTVAACRCGPARRAAPHLVPRRLARRDLVRAAWCWRRWAAWRWRVMRAPTRAGRVGHAFCSGCYTLVRVVS